MRRIMTRDPPADGGYPFDSDLHQMTDDGCPLVPDPARWVDDDWRDTLGEWDTFSYGPAEVAPTGPTIVPDSVAPDSSRAAARGPSPGRLARRLRVGLASGLTAILAPAVLLCAPATGGAGADPCAGPAYYFPTTVGTVRVYQKWVCGERDEQWTEVVTAADTAGGEAVVTVGRVGPGGTVTPWEKVGVADRRLDRLGDRGVVQNPSRCLLDLRTPPDPDRLRDDRLAGKGTHTTSGPEQIGVPAGSFLAARVTTEPPAVGGWLMVPFVETSWYAPGIGLVRYEAGPIAGEEPRAIEVVLVSVTPGKP